MAGSTKAERRRRATIKRGSRHKTLTLVFLLSPLQPHHYRKAAFEIIGVRVMSVWSDRPKTVVDIREIIGTGRRRGVCGGVRGVCGAAVARGQILLERIRRIGVFFRRIQSFQGWHMGNQSPHCRFLLYFLGKVPCVHNKAVQGKRPKGRIALDQLRQRPLGVQRRQANPFADFGGLGGRSGGHEAGGSAQFAGSAVNGHGFQSADKDRKRNSEITSASSS